MRPLSATAQVCRSDRCGAVKQPVVCVGSRGVGAMEIVAMDMKLRGMYIARQLSFTGVTFKIEEVPLTQKYIHMYNKSVRLVRTGSSLSLLSSVPVPAAHTHSASSSGSAPGRSSSRRPT